MEGGLVLDAVAGDASGEVEQRFFLVDVVERLGDGGDGKELAVGVDVVVLALVGGVGGGVFSLVGGAGGAGGEALGLVAGVAVDGGRSSFLSWVKSWSRESELSSETTETTSAACICLLM